MLDEETLYWISASSIRGVGPVTILTLYKEFNSLKSAWEAPEDKIYSCFPPNSDSPKAFIEGREKRGVLNEYWIDEIRDYDIKVIKIIDREYPEVFNKLESPPIILYCRGDTSLLNQQGYSIVGTRSPSEEGSKHAERLGGLVANNGEVHISGLAKGIDVSGHLGALREKGRSIAVLGSGLLNIYPAENEPIAEKILRSEGLLISERLPSSKVTSFQLKHRNRLIAALSKAVIIVEASENSGSLIAARHAKYLGNDIYVLGPIDQANPLQKGLQRILKRGGAKEYSLNQLMTEISSIGSIKMVDKPNNTPINASALTLYEADESYLVDLLMFALAQNDKVFKNKGEYLNNLKIHKIFYRVCEKLNLNLTRGWYLRGCYIYNNNVNKQYLSKFFSKEPERTELYNIISEEMDKIISDEKILFTKTDVFLDTLYRRYAPCNFKNIYINNHKLLLELKNIDKKCKYQEIGNLSEWIREPVEDKEYLIRYLEEILEGARQFEELLPYIDDIERVAKDIIINSEKLLESGLIKGIENYYYNNIWRLIASAVLIRTIKGPMADKVIKQTKENVYKVKELINSSQKLLLQLS